MIVNKGSAVNLPDIRITLAVLWVAGMLSSLNGDTYRLSDPVALKALLANTGPIVASSELYLIMSIIMVVPIFMSFLTLTLKYPVSRGANRIVGIIHAIIILAFSVLGLVVGSTGYGFVWSTAQLVFALLIVWYSWKWNNFES